MTNYLNSALKPVTVVLAVALLFSGCKKNELTATELGDMAEAKLKEIKALSAHIPCSQQSNVTVKEISTGCSASYYLVKSSDLARFDKLKKQYIDLLGKQADVMVKQGIIIDPCFEFILIDEQPIRTVCNADTVHLVTSENISIEEAKPLATQTYEEIMAVVNAQTCTTGSEWTATALIKDKIMDLTYVPSLRTQAYSAFKKKVALYNRLKIRIIKDQGSVTAVQPELKVDRIDCVNGKPVVKYRN